MLKEILAITGKPGLFKLVAHNGKILIVEELGSGKRFPVSPRDRIVALGDVAMYTEDGERPLAEILEVILDKQKGEAIDIQAVKGNLKETFGSFVPDFDIDRVHDSDIRKLFNWYNLLIANGITEFKDNTSTEENSENSEEKTSEK